LCKITDKITDFADLESAAEQFQDAVAFAYKENCLLTVRRNNRTHPDGIRTLQRKGGRFANGAGMSMETALFQFVHRLEKCLEHKEIALGAFLDIEGVHSTIPLLMQ
jgi:hypothetical protein